MVIAREFGGWNEPYFANYVTVPKDARTIYFAGIGAGEFVNDRLETSSDIKVQVNEVYARLAQLLTQADASIRDVIKITTYVTDPRYRDDITDVRLAAFGSDPLPVHTFIVVSALAWPGMLVEIDAVAAVSDETEKLQP